MNLRNKKTGEVRNFIINKDKIQTSSAIDCWEYTSLTKLSEEWEEYEEPKDFWYIEDFGIMCGTESEFTDRELACFTKKDIEKLKEIGNIFETEEEAEKAVEKLKALKRLKDAGFKFEGWYYDTEAIRNGKLNIRIICATLYEDENTKLSDLELLFGGKE